MSNGHEKVVLDSYALLALLEDSAGSGVVEDLFKRSGDNLQLYISEINLGEVYYILLRRQGLHAAEEVVEYAELEDALGLVEADWPMIKQAAKYKARGGLSYADCFVLALAAEKDAAIATGDPEILQAAEKHGQDIIKVK